MSTRKERWRGALAIVIAMLSVPVLLIDYQSSAGADEDAVTLTVNPEPTIPTTAVSVTTSTTEAVSATTAPPTTEASSTVPPVTAAAPTTVAATPPPTVAATQPPATTPAPTQPPATQPPAAEPPANAPPSTEPVDPAPSTTEPPTPSTEPPSTEPPATTPGTAGLVIPVAPEAGDPTPEQWSALRLCESTNNYTAISRSGRFRGAYQFSQGTWDWVAGSHHPELSGEDPAASLPANQDAMALALTRMQPARNAWPVCASKAGIG